MKNDDGINEQATARFAGLVAEIIEMAEAIRDAASEHFDLTPEEIHWGHVGDCTWTRDQLKHVLAVIRGEEGK
jgi:hypothetical protein